MWKHVVACALLLLGTVGTYIARFGLPQSEGDFANLGSFSGGSFVALITVYGVLYSVWHNRRQKDMQSAILSADFEVVPPALRKDGFHHASTQTQSASYSRKIGVRLRTLREQVLKLSLREMAEFLDIEMISTLERYENGEEEYPLRFIKQIEDFFRIRPRYIEAGEGAIFQNFILSQDSVTSFVNAGYTPILACCPSQRDDLLCYQLFERQIKGYTQIAFADRYGSFVSNGGGKMNIGYLITALLDSQKSAASVRIVKATKEEWDAIANGSYYSKNTFPRFGCADTECMDIFDTWFDEYKISREKWSAKA